MTRTFCIFYIYIFLCYQWLADISQVWLLIKLRCTLDMLALRFIIEDCFQQHFVIHLWGKFLSVVFVTPLAGIVWEPSLLSAEGFEPMTLVFLSPPIYPDPSWPVHLSFSLSSPSLPSSFSPPLLHFRSQGHSFSFCGLPWANICFKMPVTTCLPYPSDNLALPWQFSSSLSPWVHILFLLLIPLNFGGKKKIFSGESNFLI